ncbi:MAG: hypothetical protein NVV63_03035 [Opitutus sp.]|nr:hypothetical protein [Opitutus sp.]
MKLRSLLAFPIVCVVGLATPACPEESETVPLRHESLKLRDGRTLKNVEFKTYDPAKDRFYLLADRHAMIVPAKLVPQPIVDELRSSTPRRIDDETNVVPEPRPKSPKQSSQTVRRETASPSSASTSAKRNRWAEAHFGAAQKRATRYYRYEHIAGSNNIAVIALDFDWTPPLEVPGWENRYRTTGTAFLQIMDSRNRQFQRTTSEFEITTQYNPQKRMIEVVDFTRKS